MALTLPVPKDGPNWEAQMMADFPFGVGSLAATVAIAAGTSITLTANIMSVSGSGAISTLAGIPAGLTFVGPLIIIPAAGATWTTTTGGNIGLGSTSVVGKALIFFLYNGLWYPSY